ncbi:AAA family ATPase [Candidatus Saccharibacteria bacterium]|nr:AAA family ATPase [Candidatus Saccharibacteria bacterium]
MTDEQLLSEATLRAVEQYVANPTQALLLSGPIGVGKALLAKDIAAQLLGVDQNKVQEHAYIRWIEPVDSKIAISAIRELQHFMSRTVPGEGVVTRLVCIVNADTMTREAQNALLKLLEEPAERATIVLTASSPRQLLPTVRSRVQTIAVRPPALSTITDVFVQEGYDETRVQRAQQLAGDNIERLRELLSDDVDTAARDVELVKSYLAVGQFERLSRIDRELKDKQVAMQFVKTLVTMAHSSIKYSVAHNASQSLTRWQSILEAAYIARTALSRNANTKLVLTELMLSL